jgi:hypothetical protein
VAPESKLNNPNFDVLYETDASVCQDAQAIQWLHETTDLVGVVGAGERASLVAVLSLVFFTQIRHNFLSNHVFAHILRWYYVLRPGPTSVGQALFSTIVYAVTSRQWIPLVGRQFEALNQQAGVRVIMTAFYEGLKPMRAFARSMDHGGACPIVCTGCTHLLFHQHHGLRGRSRVVDGR